MPPLEVLIYLATREVFDDRFPPEVQPISTYEQLEFDPIPDASTSWADGHCHTLIRGGEAPSYRVAFPAAESWIKLFDNGHAKRFLRTPGIKAVDGVVAVCMAGYRESGVRFLPLEGGKPTLDLVEEVEAPAPRPAVVQVATIPARPVEAPPIPKTRGPKRVQLAMFGEEEAA